MQSEQRQFEAIRYAKLVEDVRQVVFDGLLADREPAGDVAVRVPGQNDADDLELSRGQSKLLTCGLRMRVGELAQSGRETVHRLMSYEVAAGDGRVDCLEKHFPGRFLQHHP